MRTWTLRRGTLSLSPSGHILGILNITPDSFSDGGRYVAVDVAVRHAQRMLQEGADVIDIGGESTRPGAQEVLPQEELRRVLPVILRLRELQPDSLLSIDTRHAQVARAALEAGVDIVNDVGGLGDPAMRQVCAEYACGIVLMHMQGTPSTMQLAPRYDDVVAEVRTFFEQRVSLAQQAGIAAEHICLDPGIGFGKTTEHNVQLIEHLEELRYQDLPMLMALSRKRFLRDIRKDTVEMSLVAAQHGADLHRVHEVAPLRAALDAANLKC